MTAADNPPGLSQLAYRVRTYAQSLAAMQANLRAFAIPSGPNAGTRPLAALTTRESDDPTIAFLDAWAMVVDVLAFYQERLANEGYLRTATERLSLIQLTSAIGYQLDPGVAAAAALAFVVEDTAATPSTVAVPAGTQVQSVPGQNQLPQVFETTAAISARAGWNALRPRLTQPQQLSPAGGGPTTSTLTFAGTSLAVQPGALLWVADHGQAVHVAQTTVDFVGGTTRVLLDEAVPLAPPPARPPEPTLPVDVQLPLPLTPANVSAWILGHTWQAPDLDVFLRQVGWDPDAVVGVTAALLAQAPPAGSAAVSAFGQKVGFLGRTLGAGPALPTSVTGNTATTGGITTGGASSGGVSVGATVWSGQGAGSTALLERTVPGIVAGSTVVLVDTTPQTSLSPAGFGVAGAVDQLAAINGANTEVTALALQSLVGPPPFPPFPVAGTMAYVQSVPLSLAPTVPLSDTVAVQPTSVVLDHLTLGLEPEQLVAWTGQRVDPATGLQVDPAGATQTEIVTLAGVSHAGGYTTLTFTAALDDSYDLSTVTLNANVAPATHGQTVTGEVLGSGDGSQQNQTFVLAKPNLTHVPAAPGDGGVTGTTDTLAVSVNGVPWQEVPSLFGQGGQSRAYAVRTDDQGKTQVLFGDGQAGARIPTGQENVTATYRTGLGPAGNVLAGSLMLLFNRPLGIRSVQNPLPASGGVAPETLDDARAGAPRAVRTLGRIVTLSDYADFAGDFPGVGKAQAIALESAGNPLAHLTVAPDGGTLPADPDGFLASLRSAISALADPSQQSQVDWCNTLYFGVTATLLRRPGAAAAPVIAAATGALASAFGFAARSFGQSVRAAEVLVVLQNVPGVLGVQMQPLLFAGETGSGSSLLAAQSARFAPGGAGQTDGADLILFSPSYTFLTS